MLDYKDRLNDAWDKVPQHRQKAILEELEHKAYKQDFDTCNSDTSCERNNLLEPLAESIVSVMNDCADAIVIIGRLIKQKFIK